RRPHARSRATAAPAPPQRAPARRDARDAVTHLDDLSGTLAAAGLGRRPGLAAQQLATIQRRGPHAHEPLAGLGLGRRRLAELGTRATRPGRNPVSLHARSSW